MNGAIHFMGGRRKIIGPRWPTLFDDLPFPGPPLTSSPPPVSPPTPPATNISLTVDEAIRIAIDLELRAGPKTAADLVEGLAKVGIGVKASPTGFRFHLEGCSYKGSELGEDYTLAGLTARGLVPVHLAELRTPAGRQGESYKPPLAEIMLWPDRVEPGPGARRDPLPTGSDPESVSARVAFRERFRAFVNEQNLLFWKIKNSSVMEFYHRSTAKRERAGLAFIDRGDALDVRIALAQNILAALRFGVWKWGAVATVGAPDFIILAETLALEHGISLGSS